MHPLQVRVLGVRLQRLSALRNFAHARRDLRVISVLNLSASKRSYLHGSEPRNIGVAGEIGCRELAREFKSGPTSKHIRQMEQELLAALRRLSAADD